MREMYPDLLTPTIARELGRSTRAVSLKAMALGIRKSAEFNASPKSGRFPSGIVNGTVFQPGFKPWNKGVKGSTGLHENCRPTQFKPGRLASESNNYQPIGTERLNRDGCLERKLTDDKSIVPARRWVAIHRIVWESVHGPIPRGCAVVFRKGMKTIVSSEITIDRLEMLTRAQLMKRNSVHTNYPPEIARIAQLRGALTRQINKRSRALEET